MTPREALVFAIGEDTVHKLWPVVRGRVGLLSEIVGTLLPRYDLRVDGYGRTVIVDDNADSRANWITARCRELDAIEARNPGNRP